MAGLGKWQGIFVGTDAAAREDWKTESIVLLFEVAIKEARAIDESDRSQHLWQFYLRNSFLFLLFVSHLAGMLAQFRFQI